MLARGVWWLLLRGNTGVGEAGGMTRLVGVTNAALGASPVNDYNPGNINAINRLVLTMTGDTSLTGIVAPTLDGQLLLITNDDAVDTLTLPVESGTSTAANRFFGITDIAVPPHASVLCCYDKSSLNRWVLIA